VSSATRPLIHIAGNAVLNVLVRDAGPGEAEAVASWSRGSVRFLDQPVEPALGGTAATAGLLGRLGARVTLNAPIGEDAFGAVVRKWLADAGVALVGGGAAASTAVNVILVAADGTPRWNYYTGQEVDWRRSLAATDATWFYASGYGGASGRDLAVLREVFGAFRSRGARVAFDPGPWLFARSTRAAMEQAWADVDCLIGTEAELSTWHAGDTLAGLIGRLLALGPRRVVVKRGADGAAFGEARGDAHELPAARVEAAHAVGAGDAFNAALLQALAGGAGLRDAVAAAIGFATAAVARGKGGAIPGRTPP
jgi:sugar/nucleoside kinase (ribokinase family)